MELTKADLKEQLKATKPEEKEE